MLYWGFDLGDGESAVARVAGNGGLPEIVDIDGRRVVITAWAVMKNGEVRIGEHAARSAAAAIRSAARFKSRFLDPAMDSSGLLRDFSAKILETLRRDGTLKGGEKSNSFYIGCPAGWNREARAQYQTIFENLGVPSPHVISESRAVLVGAIQSNYLREYVDLQTRAILVVDIGSSTTDFAYVSKGKEREIRTGGEVALGGGIMDELLLEACVDASPDAQAIREVFAACESWRVDCELHARALKERYYTEEPDYWTQHSCRESLLITYDKPLVLDLYMDAAMARRLTEQPCRQLQGRSFREVFCHALREVSESVDEDPPELLFLTGGVSRMREIAEWCRAVFPDAAIYSDSEPEFSVARGLAWCGRVDDELGHFREEVEALIHSTLVEDIVSGHLPALYNRLLEQLLDPILEHAVEPTLLEWRDGKIETIAGIRPVLQERLKVFLYSREAKELFYGPVGAWLQQVSESLSAYTSAICRKYRVPDRALVISSELSAVDLQHLLEKIGNPDVLAGQSITGAAVFMESIISVLVGLLCGGSGVVLVAEGPVGIAVGIISSGLFFAVANILGKKAVDQKIMSMNLPLFVRKMAFANPFPKLEVPGLNLSNPFKDTGEETGETASEGVKLSLLPKLTWNAGDAIPERRLRAIRGKIRSSLSESMNDPENLEMVELNERVCREISEQIELRLKQLAEQVEIPL